jgi:HEPN domain-containing protein
MVKKRRLQKDEEPTKGMRRLDYFEAANERFQQASAALEKKNFGLALTLVGVAVECVLRAYRPQGAPFNSRHDLMELAGEADFFPAKDQDLQEALTSALTELRLVWRNSHRYKSETKLQTFLKSLRRYPDNQTRGPKGALKVAAGNAIANAKLIIGYGVKRWDSVNG